MSREPSVLTNVRSISVVKSRLQAGRSKYKSSLEALLTIIKTVGSACRYSCRSDYILFLIRRASLGYTRESAASCCRAC
jgi:hypothetical protein